MALTTNKIRNYKIIFLLSIIVVAILLSFIFIYLLNYNFRSPNLDLSENKIIIIKKGQNFKQISNLLESENIIQNADFFYYISRIIKKDQIIVKSGEYLFEKYSSAYQILDKITNGDVNIRFVTLAEGLSIHSILKIIDTSYGLTGNLPKNIAEGSLLPETYSYQYGDKKSDLIKRMQNAMQNSLDKAWQERQDNLPIKNKQEALILASIVEKETGIASERNIIASVFINRLKIGMKLQSDPTIIYSFAFGDKEKERIIRKSDINNRSNFNTYHIYGLPPTPIACPGIDAIKAVLNPDKTKYLYFVAKSANINSGHNFATNLKDHNKFVRQYRNQLSK